MKAILLDGPGRPLRLADVSEPVAGPGEVLLRVRACGVCRTDLHIFDGEVTGTRWPLIPGHQMVATRVDDGRRVGVPWLGWTDGSCRYCTSGRENLCDAAFARSGPAGLVAPTWPHPSRSMPP